MRFRIDFHGPFRVATGRADRGVDVAVDLGDPLPASSIKGVMRQSAAVLSALGLCTNALVEAVFGVPGTPSPWRWVRPEFDQTPRRHERRRVTIGENHVAEERALVAGEELWAGYATFEIVVGAQLTSTERSRHEALLVLAAAGVKSLGADRNRGFGWVSMTPVEDESDRTPTERFSQALDDLGGES